MSRVIITYIMPYLWVPMKAIFIPNVRKILHCCKEAQLRPLSYGVLIPNVGNYITGLTFGVNVQT